MKLTRKEYTDPAEKKRDFWKGFWLWWVLNILMWIISIALSALLANLPYGDNGAYNLIGGTTLLVINFVPLLVNVGLMIYFGLTRTQIMRGMLTAFGVALGIVVLLGIAFTVYCFVMLANE
jgi:ABC-type amino acid transport system permease subunit